VRRIIRALSSPRAPDRFPFSLVYRAIDNMRAWSGQPSPRLGLIFFALRAGRRAFPGLAAAHSALHRDWAQAPGHSVDWIGPHHNSANKPIFHRTAGYKTMMCARLAALPVPLRARVHRWRAYC